MDGQRHAPAVLSPGKNTGAHRAGDLVGPEPDGYGKEKNLSLLTVKHVAIRYTD